MKNMREREREKLNEISGFHEKKQLKYIHSTK